MSLLVLQGIGVARGCVIGKVALIERDIPEVIEYTLSAEQIETEVARFLSGLDSAKQQLRDIRERIPDNASADVNAFIDTHLLMLDDAILSKAPVQLIRDRHCNAEWALKLQRDRVVQVFEEMDDPYLSTRRDDVDHVVARILRILSAADTTPNDVVSSRLENRIVVADDLTPADTILMQHQGVLAFITEYGGPLSHTAILARSLELPAIVGVRNARRYLQEDEEIVIDGDQGVIVAGLDEATLAHYLRKQKHLQQRRRTLERLKEKTAVTLDGVTVELHANIELPEDTTAAARMAAMGVGLYRTEYLFMNRPDVPDEEEQLAAYLKVIDSLEKRPLTIRTVDLGADKQVDSGRIGRVATNPALGLRGIRLCLQDQNLFRPQLRAILRASKYGPVRMMIPMLSNLQELLQVRQLIDKLKTELHDQGIGYDPQLPIGGMIEVPGAAVCAAYFAHYLDFLSIGTNDLIQYTLAIDRVDDEVNYLYDPLHPAVLNLIHTTIQAGYSRGIPVSLCGEMAGDPRYTRLLLGLGLTQFSMHPANLLEIKQTVNSSNVRECKQLAGEILQTRDVRELDRLIAAITRR